MQLAAFELIAARCSVHKALKSSRIRAPCFANGLGYGVPSCAGRHNRRQPLLKASMQPDDVAAVQDKDKNNPALVSAKAEIKRLSKLVEDLNNELGGLQKQLREQAALIGSLYMQRDKQEISEKELKGLTDNQNKVIKMLEKELKNLQDGGTVGVTQAPPHSIDVFSYLAGQGFAAAELEAIHRKYPDVAKLDVDARVKPVIEYFQGLGLSSSQVVKVVGNHPRVLSFSVSDELQPIVDWLLEQGVDRSIIGLVLVRHTLIFDSSIEKNLQPMLDHLVGLGLEPENFRDVVLQSTIITMAIETINAQCDVLRLKYGLPEDFIQDVINTKPLILQRDVSSIFNSYLDAGLTRAEIRSLVMGKKNALMYNIHNKAYKVKVQFYLGVAQWTIQDIAERPHLLDPSLKTIESRWKAAVQQGSMPRPTPKQFANMLQAKPPKVQAAKGRV